MKTIVMTDRVAPRAALPTSSLAAPIKLVRRWFDVAEQRRALVEISEHQLKDIGLTRFDAEAEAARPFWDIGA